jgi:hypothetical protein
LPVQPLRGAFVNPADRARAAHAQAEAASDPRDRAAWLAAAAAWEKIAAPGQTWSMDAPRAAMARLRRDLRNASGPFQAPRPPKAPPPQAVAPQRKREEATIEF